MLEYDFTPIKEYREQFRITQAEAADRAGVAYQQWQRWESGESIPSAANLCKIANALNLCWDAMQLFFKFSDDAKQLF